MRILHLVQRYHPAPGGAENHLGTLSACLAAAGHEVTVATSDALDIELFWRADRRRIPEPSAIHKGVTIRRFPVRHMPLPTAAYALVRRLLWLGSRLPFFPLDLLNRLARLTPRLPDLWRWLATTEIQFDLVAGMTITYESLLLAGLAFARRRGIPFVTYPLTHLGAGPAPGQDALSRFYTMRHQVALVLASDAIMAQTDTEKEYFAGRGYPAQRIHVVGPGVTPDAVAGGDGARFRRQHNLDGPVILSIAAMSSDKGTVHTVEATRRLWQEGVPVDLVLIGAILAPFQRYLDQLPAADRARITLLGPADDATKRDALAAATLLALPSRTDSFGIVFLEAWLYGKPVVAARTWGVTDVVRDGANGLVVPFGDVRALSSAFRRLIDQPELATQLGERGRRDTLTRHTWSQKCAAVHTIYRRLAAAAGGDT